MDSVGSSNPASDYLSPIPPPDHSPHAASPPPLYHDTDRPEHRDALRKESAMQVVHSENKSLHDHKALFASLLSSLVCQICLDLLHKPFALTPCGHISCYGCLINWFNADRQLDELEGDNVFRKKTCPQCRAVVRGRPVEAWNVKDMVAAVVKSGLALDFPPPVEVDSNEAASGELAQPGLPLRDPWTDVFPPLPLRRGLSPPGGSPDAFGMFDAEDQVYRCLDCMHEIWGRSCSRCGRQYDGHNVDPSDDEAPPEDHHGIWSILPVMEHIMGWPRAASVNGSEGGSYEASFIDDEGSQGGTSEAIEVMSDNSHSVTETTQLASGQDGDGSRKVRILLPIVTRKSLN
jgi:DNA-directed RNA polymerase subunit RPC12/RpoP